MFTSTTAIGFGVLREPAGAQAPKGGADFGVTLSHQAQQALESAEMGNVVERTGSPGGLTRGQALASAEELKQTIGISGRQPDRVVEHARPGDVAAAENLKRLLGVNGPAEVLAGVATPGTDLSYVYGGVGGAPLKTPLLGFRISLRRNLPGPADVNICEGHPPPPFVDVWIIAKPSSTDRGGTIVASGRRRADRLFYLEATSRINSASQPAVSMQVSVIAKNHAAIAVNAKATLWHQRLGHASFDILRRIPSLDLPKNAELPFCKACAFSKTNRLPYNAPATMRR
ncbi:MAG: hypothetical protein BJ554DRAFT_2584 [Olpidium bornovanus]|uniref:GAG-pre-integrase domain-containing protein n=1 Tax=Olpidium bornovanus TaxID=278681 RepID=A0A8H8A0Y8_9FUNG|nr:MAG: hypothetical protein BJ554DRAFT_2584 [Olpidium bornovanus]